MKRPRGTCPDCGKDVPLRRDGSPCDHWVDVPGQVGGPYCTPRLAKERRTAEALEAAKRRYFQRSS